MPFISPACQLAIFFDRFSVKSWIGDTWEKREEKQQASSMNAKGPRKRPLRPETPPVRQTVIPLLPILFLAATSTTFVSLPFLLPRATTYLHIITIGETPRREIPHDRRRRVLFPGANQIA